MQENINILLELLSRIRPP